MRYLVVVEKGATSFGAYVPDLPGCVAAGETRDEVLALIREAIEFHIEGLKQDGQPIPPPSGFLPRVSIAATPHMFTWSAKTRRTSSGSSRSCSQSWLRCPRAERHS